MTIIQNSILVVTTQGPHIAPLATLASPCRQELPSYQSGSLAEALPRQALAGLGGHLCVGLAREVRAPPRRDGRLAAAGLHNIGGPAHLARDHIGERLVLYRVAHDNGVTCTWFHLLDEGPAHPPRLPDEPHHQGNEEEREGRETRNHGNQPGPGPLGVLLLLLCALQGLARPPVQQLLLREGRGRGLVAPDLLLQVEPRLLVRVVRLPELLADAAELVRDKRERLLQRRMRGCGLRKPLLRRAALPHRRHEVLECGVAPCLDLAHVALGLHILGLGRTELLGEAALRGVEFLQARSGGNQLVERHGQLPLRLRVASLRLRQ
mmetsp:Transcript_1663/g.4986  ORF Transcript_1663/g.4986 Transcript_1663/m.4986 type:complete len:322 (-) Transcript_1663:1119-2084(-)